MRRPILPLLLLLANCHQGQGTSAVPIPVPAESFDYYLSRAKTHDTTLDFAALRLSYTKTREYSPYGGDDQRDSMWVALDKDSLRQALSFADQILSDNPVDPDAHVGAAYAAAHLGDSTRALHHRWMAHGLLESIRRSGLGTRTSPMIVISVSEEYSLARYLGFRRSGQQVLAECNQHPCDAVVFSVPNAANDTTLYFDVSIPYRHLEDSLEH